MATDYFSFVGITGFRPAKKPALTAKFVIANFEHDIFKLCFKRKRAEQELRPLL